MRLSQEVIADLVVLLRRTSVSLACEEAGVSVGSYYRWHWESRKLSRRRVPNSVDIHLMSVCFVSSAGGLVRLVSIICCVSV